MIATKYVTFGQQLTRKRLFTAVNSPVEQKKILLYVGADHFVVATLIHVYLLTCNTQRVFNVEITTSDRNTTHTTKK